MESIAINTVKSTLLSFHDTWKQLGITWKDYSLFCKAFDLL